MQLHVVLFLAGLSMARAVEVCKVADLSLVTQTGEFFLAGQHSSLTRTMPFGEDYPVLDIIFRLLW
jgi:hypothetical protein